MSNFGLPYLVDERDMTSQFNTELSPIEEAAFQSWATKSGRLSDLYDYDLRGAWKSGLLGDGHLPDTFKKPNHPTFSDESMYSQPGVAGGKWGDGTFSPSQANLRSYPRDELEAYFIEREPGYQLTGNLIPKP